MFAFNRFSLARNGKWSLWVWVTLGLGTYFSLFSTFQNSNWRLNTDKIFKTRAENSFDKKNEGRKEEVVHWRRNEKETVTWWNINLNFYWIASCVHWETCWLNIFCWCWKMILSLMFPPDDVYDSLKLLSCVFHYFGPMIIIIIKHKTRLLLLLLHA